MGDYRDELQSLGEFGLIQHLTDQLPKDPSVLKGVGDDCAVFDIAGEKWLVSTDAAVESVHFSREYATFYEIGWKSAAAALSDIAAMGGTPRFVLVSMAIPQNMSLKDIEGLYSGIRDVVQLMKAVIVGGDITRSSDKLFMDFTVMGVSGPGRCLMRSGSQHGDLIAVSGYPGDAAAGLLFLQKGIEAPELQQAHLHPSPRCAEAQWLAQQQGVHAMIDLSDGLMQDCGHLAEASKLSFHLETAVMPISTYLKQYAAQLDCDPLELVLSGGEAYELVFTLSPGRAVKIQQAFEARFSLPCSLIGKVARGTPEVQVFGALPEFRGGYDHFRS